MEKTAQALATEPPKTKDALLDAILQLTSKLADLKDGMEKETEELQQLEKSIERDRIEVAKRMSQRRTRQRVALMEATQHQPAGTPWLFFEPGMDLVLAPGYAKKRKREPLPPPDPLKPEEIEAKQKAEEERRAKFDKMMTQFWEHPETDACRVRNSFHSDRLQGTVTISQSIKTGKLHWSFNPDREVGVKTTLMFNSLLATVAYNLECEKKAMEKLAGHLSEAQYLQYVMAGMFAEFSQRSCVTYVFRRMRPTLALKYDEENKAYRYLAALCHHPQGYYRASWAGTLVPTDDVISHLMFMRADEADFWRRSTQHPLHAVQADF